MVPRNSYHICHGIDLLHSLHLVGQSTRLVVQGVHQLPPTCWSSGLLHRRQARSHLMQIDGYIFVSSCMHRRPPPKNPIKGCVLSSKVSQSLVLELSTSQNPSHDQHPGLHHSVIPTLTTNTLYLFIISLFASLLPHHLPYHYCRVTRPKHN